MTRQQLDISPVHIGDRCRELNSDCILHEGALRKGTPPYHEGCDCYVTIDLSMVMADSPTTEKHDNRA